MLLAGMLATAPPAQAQDYQQFTFDLDTATNAETLTFSVPSQISDYGTYHWVVDQTVISGTVASVETKVLSSAGLDTAAAFAPAVTDSTNGDLTLSGTAYGLRQKLTIKTTGTQSSSYQVSVVFKPIE